MATDTPEPPRSSRKTRPLTEAELEPAPTPAGEQQPEPTPADSPPLALLGRFSPDTWLQIGASIAIPVLAVIAGWLLEVPLLIQNLDKAIWLTYASAVFLLIAALRQRRGPRLALAIASIAVGAAGLALNISRPWCEPGEPRILVREDGDGEIISMRDQWNTESLTAGVYLQVQMYIAHQAEGSPESPLSAICTWSAQGDGRLIGQDGCAAHYQMGGDAELDMLQIAISRPSCNSNRTPILFLHPENS